MSLINPNPPILQKGDIVYWCEKEGGVKHFGKVNKVLKEGDPNYIEVWGSFYDDLKRVKASTGQAGYIFLNHAFLFQRLSWKQRIADKD